MKCISCGSTIIDPEVTKCPNCGISLSRQGSETNMFSCPDCGKEISIRAVSCPNCGRPIKSAEKEIKRSSGLKALFYICCLGSIFSYIFGTLESVIIGVIWTIGVVVFTICFCSYCSNADRERYDITYYDKMKKEGIVMSVILLIVTVSRIVIFMNTLRTATLILRYN